MSKYRIAVIATWFGSLPAYFQAWLHSAERNPDIDFLLFFDQNVESKASNIHLIRTSLEAEVKRAADKLNENITIDNANKFCDMRHMFGLIYGDYLQEYDFWAYCDIDLVFGNIRDFVTDKVLECYDRIYNWGHFSIYRNVDRINHLFDGPNGIYTRDEIFRGTIKLNSEEHFGNNIICEKAGIPWYQEDDFADFWPFYSDMRLWGDNNKNYTHQVFYWDDGHVCQAYISADGSVGIREYVYLHWQKRKPVPDGDFLSDDSFFITSKRLIKKEKGIPAKDLIIELCPERSETDREKEKRAYIRTKLLTFVKAPWAQKRIWMRQKMTLMRTKGYLLDKGDVKNMLPTKKTDA